jgi:hypothetical protein
MVHSAVAQCLALRATKDIFDRVVLELVTSEAPVRLVASIVESLLLHGKSPFSG